MARERTNAEALSPGNLETKTFPLEIKELTEEGVFEGYAAIFGKKDKFGEVIEKGAFKKTLKEKKTLPLLWYHDPRNPIGVVTDIKTDNTGLLVKGQLNLEVQSAREKYALMKQKAIRGLSFGFRTVKDLWDNNGRTRRLTELKLFEISPCTFQMHPKALVRQVKSEEEDDVIEALEEVKAYLDGFGTIEAQSGRRMSATHFKQVSDAVEVLNDALEKLKPPESKGTPVAKKSPYSPIHEALGKESKPDIRPLAGLSFCKALGDN